MLSERERQVADLVAIGLTNKGIAGHLRLSVSRVEDILRAIGRKWRLDRTRNLRVQITLRVLAAAA